MKIVDTCVKRPVFTTMMIMSLVVLGLFSYARMGVDLYPNVEFPFVTVQTTLSGASPEEIETSITKPIEESVNTISGIEQINSTSAEGTSMVLIKFVLEKNNDVAAQDVRDKVSAVQKDLPQGTDSPIIGKFDVGSIAVLNIAVSGNKDLVELTRIAKKQIKENIETVSGVGSAEIVGGREREIHVIINPLKMAALGINSKMVKDAISQQNIEIPGGNVEQTDKQFGLRILGRIKSADDFKNIVVATRDNTPIHISDIGTVKDTGEYMTTAAYLNGRPCVNVAVKKQSGTNTVAVIDSIKERMEEIKSVLPEGVNVEIIGDQSTFIKESVATVKEHLILGALFAALMVLLFMGDFRSTIISAMAIPASVIGTFIFMQMAGFTLNNMTLLGLTIAVGLVIDDAIVMLENIYRHMDELGKKPMTAALEGASEIAFAIIAMSLSLLVIFLPLAYISGIVGRFIKSYGLTIAFAVAISTFVALTLTPMLCSVFLKVKHNKRTAAEIFTDNVNHVLAKHYIVMLEWALKHRKLMVISSIVIMLSTVPLLKFIGKDFMPEDDTGQYVVNITAPEGSSLATVTNIFGQVETELRRLPHVKNVLSSIGTGSFGISSTNEGSILVELTPAETRKLSMKQIMKATRDILSKYRILRTSVNAAGGFSGGKEYDLNYVISGPDLDQLQKYADTVADALRKEKGIVDVDLSFSFAKPEYRVEIDRSRAHDLGVKIEDIASSLRTMVSGEEDITKYKEADDLYQVRLRSLETYRDRPEAISAMTLPSTKGLVRLDSIATVKPGLGPTKIKRYNRQRQITVEANLDGIPLGVALQKADEAFKKLNPPANYHGEVVGKAKELGRMLSSFLMAFLMSFLFIYIVLASQFESFVYPISIIICLPLTIPFAVLSLFITHENLTLFSIMGMFMLVGIVKKNAILQVDYTNTLRAEGQDRHTAMINANRTRLRPILMTTLTLIASMIPTAFGTGAGSGVRRTMAWVIIGGQALSLLITLLMTPVTYSLMDDLQEWWKHKRHKKAGHHETAQPAVKEN